MSNSYSEKLCHIRVSLNFSCTKNFNEICLRANNEIWSTHAVQFRNRIFCGEWNLSTLGNKISLNRGTDA